MRGVSLPLACPKIRPWLTHDRVEVSDFHSLATALAHENQPAFKVEHLDAIGATREDALIELLAFAQGLLCHVGLGDVVSLDEDASDLAFLITGGLVDERQEALFHHRRGPFQPNWHTVG